VNTISGKNTNWIVQSVRSKDETISKMHLVLNKPLLLLRKG